MILRELEGLGYHVCIGGFRTEPVADVDELIELLSAEASPHTFQVFDADRVAGWRHLFFAALNAVKAFRDGYNVSQSLGIEVLVYASCQRQIREAFRIVGVRLGCSRIAFIILSDSAQECVAAYRRCSQLLGVEDDSVLEVSGEKLEVIKEVYGVTPQEMESRGGEAPGEAVSWLIVERMALLSVRV